VDPKLVFPEPWFPPSEASSLRQRMRDFFRAMDGPAGTDYSMAIMPGIPKTRTYAINNSAPPDRDVPADAAAAPALPPHPAEGVPPKAAGEPPNCPRSRLDAEHYSVSAHFVQRKDQERPSSSDKDKITCETGESPVDHVHVHVKRNSISSGITSSLEGFVTHPGPMLPASDATALCTKAPQSSHTKANVGGICQMHPEVADTGVHTGIDGNGVGDLTMGAPPRDALAKALAENEALRARIAELERVAAGGKPPPSPLQSLSREEIDIVRRQRLYRELGYFPQGQYVKTVNQLAGFPLTPPGFIGLDGDRGAGLPYVKHQNVGTERRAAGPAPAASMAPPLRNKMRKATQ